MIALLLGLTLALPANTNGTQVEVTGSGGVSYISGGDATSDSSGTGGGGALAVDVFARRLVDDDAAPPLQPFLQRATRFHLDAGGGGGSSQAIERFPTATLPGPLPRWSASSASGFAAASAEGYLGRWFFLGGGLGFSYLRERTVAFAPPMQPTGEWGLITLPIYAEAGVRMGDLRLLAGWTVAPFRQDQGDWRVAFWGNAYVQADAVIRRFVGVGARVTVLDGGASVDGWADVWLARRLGLLVGVGGGRSSSAPAASLDDVHGSIGAQYWFHSRWAASVSYAPSWTRASLPGSDGSSGVAHAVTLALTMRL